MFKKKKTFLRNPGGVEQLPELLHVEPGAISSHVGSELLLPQALPEHQQVVDELRGVPQAGGLVHGHWPELAWNYYAHLL